MEIPIKSMVLESIFLFKIDLIVWKWSAIPNADQIVIGFKIDLIVWKYRYRMVELRNPILFKIDLIVWKYLGEFFF